MSLGITNNNNRRSPLETNRSFIFPPSNNKIWTTEPQYLLQLQEEVLKKKVFGNITNINDNTNNIRQSRKKIETFPSVDVIMPIHFVMTPHFQSLFVGNNNFWLQNIGLILQNIGLNFLHYDSSNNSLRYTYIPNINIKTKEENQKIMATCYCHLKALIDEHIYSIIDNKVKSGMLTLDHEYQYATRYLQHNITKNTI
jgi:hypothetical protein